jgi:protein disulfide-isomerase A1
VVVDPAQFPGLEAKLGLEPGVFPSGAVHQLSKNRIFPYPRGQAYDTASLRKWGSDVQSGRVKPWRPPGVKITNDDLEIVGGKMKATARVSMGGKWHDAAHIKIAGRDEL